MPGSRLLLTRSEHFVPVHLDMCQLVPLREGFLENGRNQPAKAGSVIFSRTAEYHGRAFTRLRSAKEREHNKKEWVTLQRQEWATLSCALLTDKYVGVGIDGLHHRRLGHKPFLAVHRLSVAPSDLCVAPVEISDSKSSEKVRVAES